MKAFKDLKSQWENQPQVEAPEDGSTEIINKIHAVKKKQGITNIVLTATVLILISFFFYINAYKNSVVSLALFLMIGSLLVRVFIELLSIKKLNRLDVTSNAETFKNTMVSYYKSRIRTHYIVTPIICTLYIIGFVILLPFFKEALSNWFYNYIKISAIVILIVLTFFILKQIKKEIRVLEQLK